MGQSSCNGSHQANRLTDVNIQSPLLYQIGIHCGVKPTVVNDVIDVPIGVVVAPTGGYGTQQAVSASVFSLGFVHTED